MRDVCAAATLRPHHTHGGSRHDGRLAASPSPNMRPRERRGTVRRKSRATQNRGLRCASRRSSVVPIRADPREAPSRAVRRRGDGRPTPGLPAKQGRRLTITPTRRWGHCPRQTSPTRTDRKLTYPRWARRRRWRQRQCSICRYFVSRRSDSNRGPLHYEFRAAVTTSHQESPQVTPRAKSAGLEMTHDDWR
jgi:hypothetical protein